MPELKLYTVNQLREWLEHNRAAEGLSEQVIAPVRAWAIIHNPYVNAADPVVAAIITGGEIAACTTAFPELINGQRYWWFSALWCNPKYQGNGYGLIVVGSLAEVYGYEFCLDRWGAPETTEIFSHIGHKTCYTTRYLLGSKIDKSTIRGKFVAFLRAVQKSMHCVAEKSQGNDDYSLRYIPNIDDATYAFITAHSNGNYMLRSQETLNWTLHYPFTISAPLYNRVKNRMPFAPSELSESQSYAVQVWDADVLIGFYIMKKKDQGLHILYLYYDEAQKNKVFASIRDHVKQMRIEQCVTENKGLADYLQRQLYFPKSRVANISFSVPKSMPLPQDGDVQYGDGDCFTA